MNKLSGGSDAQYDPINEEIFDPVSEEIFDPKERFYPARGIPFRAICEGIYDSYGNRINPSGSNKMFLSLLAWIIKWENFIDAGFQSDCDQAE